MSEDHNHVQVRMDQNKLAREYIKLKNMCRRAGRQDLADEVRCYCLADSAAEATHAYPAEGQGPAGETVVVLLRECHPEVCRMVCASPQRNEEMRKFYEEVVVPNML